MFECFVTGCEGRVSASFASGLIPAAARCERCGVQYRRDPARAWFLRGRVKVTFLSAEGDVSFVSAEAVSVAPHPLVVVGANVTQRVIAPKEVISVERLL